jgi:ribose transport system ATP-binding protein
VSGSGGEGPVLELENVWKAYTSQVALQAISLRIAAGEVRGLVGQNGSGKSTLVKVLSGFHAPAPGAKGWLDGKPFPFGSVRAIHSLGVRFVHQDLGLVDSLSVADNLALANGFSSGPLLRLRREARYAREVMSVFDVDVDVDAPVASLSPVQRSLVAICRALGEQDTARLLVLDEPTVALPAAEVSLLLDALRSLAERGLAILYISHNLGEVVSISDSVSVLRDGRLVGDVPRSEAAVKGLVALMSGGSGDADPLHVRGAAPQAAGEPVLRVVDLAGMTFERLSFEVAAGEIVGMTGLIGSGVEELPGVLAGGSRALRGRVIVGGKAIDRYSPRAALEHGIVVVARDRARHSLISSFMARENVFLLTAPRFPQRKWRRSGVEAREAASWMRRFDVRPVEPQRTMSMFSGGNQQKIVIARSLRAAPTVLVLDEPVQGVDALSRAQILRQIGEATESLQLGVVIVSTELDELAAICDRILVFRSGRVICELSGADGTPERILMEMAG